LLGTLTDRALSVVGDEVAILATRAMRRSRLQLTMLPVLIVELVMVIVVPRLHCAGYLRRYRHEPACRAKTPMLSVERQSSRIDYPRRNPQK
jgi:hypothetical protein